jgi:polyhydroxyalkanoate synthesis regulator phasin
MDQSTRDRHSIVAPLRRMMLFSVGSMLIFQEKTAEFIEHAIERGQEAQEEGKKIVQEMRTERRKRRPETKDALDIRINNALKRLNVPSQKDIEELDRHITALAERIDDLKSAG